MTGKVILDAIVRKMPPDEFFREILRIHGVGWHASTTIGKSLAKELAKFWGITTYDV